jgi:hypothetical protein
MSTAKGKSEAESEKRLEYLRKRAYKNLKSRELCGVERERERERERESDGIRNNPHQSNVIYCMNACMHVSNC